MRTTIDVPDEMFHAAKVLAAQRKTTLRELVLAGLDQVMQNPVDREAIRRKRAESFLEALDADNHEPVAPLSREEIYNQRLNRFGQD
ncbi:MAG: hypothetical protein JJU05_07040 [Verrucomicrobia bacterium]|nr:hypothetical protein [Verrucomicrobiota bacterium]MCH8526052.1 hypothetical protein [Kiritimatiellia bacterium]